MVPTVPATRLSSGRVALNTAHRPSSGKNSGRVASRSMRRGRWALGRLTAGVSDRSGLTPWLQRCLWNDELTGRASLSPRSRVPSPRLRGEG